MVQAAFIFTENTIVCDVLKICNPTVETNKSIS